MSAPFQPGDVVVCVDDRNTQAIRRGNCYRIERVVLATGALDGHFGAGLMLFGTVPDYPGCDYFCARRFRKIDDEVTEDFREQLRSLKSPKPTLNPARHSRERVG